MASEAQRNTVSKVQAGHLTRVDRFAALQHKVILSGSTGAPPMALQVTLCPRCTQGFPQATAEGADAAFESFPDLNRPAGMLGGHQMARDRYRNSQAFELISVDTAALL